MLISKFILMSGNSARRSKADCSAVVNLANVSFSGVCPVIDHEFRHNIVKVAGVAVHRL